MNTDTNHKDSRNYRFAIGCGGTGGHIVPALALARELSRSGHRILFIGNRNSLEEKLVTAENYEFKAINVQKLYRKLSLAQLLFPVRLFGAVISCLFIHQGYKPDAVVCTGGFVAGPVALASILKRIPLFFHESNSLPGITTRFLAKRTRVTYTAFAGTAKRLPGVRAKQLGIPVLRRIEAGFELQQLGLTGTRPVIVISGGSQGSLAINRAVDQILPQLLQKGFEVIWQTGRLGFEEFSRLHRETAGVYVFDFSPLLTEFYGKARLAVTRAGAMTIAELEAARLPAVLVPLPTAAENHQYYNALEQQQQGRALLLSQKEMTPSALLDAISRLDADHGSYLGKLKAIPPNTAARDIAADILRTLDKEN
jgi:UDP-N-acetylglucosamine--N-acetylmuramyl-(pentapeptide) pyrophosphoryl-undecaprenol N-acetylglucosamine transferase